MKSTNVIIREVIVSEMAADYRSRPCLRLEDGVFPINLYNFMARNERTSLKLCSTLGVLLIGLPLFSVNDVEANLICTLNQSHFDCGDTAIVGECGWHCTGALPNKMDHF
jgi:hypothetical protein